MKDASDDGVASGPKPRGNHGRRAFAGGVVLAGALGVFAALGFGALRLATLPAAGTSLEGSGLPQTLDLERAEIDVDEARGTAWLVGEKVACALDLVAVKALGCEEIPAALAPPRVLVAGSDLYVVLADAKGPRDAIAFDWLVLDGAGHVRARGNAGPKLPTAWSTGAAMLNLGWDPGARAATLAFTWNEEGVGRRVVRLPIQPSFGVGDPSIRRLGDRDVVVASFAKDDRLLLADRTMRSEGHVDPVPAPEGACVGDRSISCVTVQGMPRAGQGAVAVLISADGEVHLAAALPGAVDASPSSVARQRIAYVATKDLSAPRLVTLAGGRLTEPLADGALATFEVRDAEDQHLLFGRVGDGAWKRLARGASPIDAWTVIPHAKGALAIDARSRRAVVLGDALTPLDRHGRFATLVELAREKWPTADLDVKLFVAALVLFPLLFGLAVRAELRRGDRVSRALFAIAAWAVATLLFVIIRRAALFPP